MINTEIRQRSFLKWAGNKYLLIEEITKSLPPAGKLIEPFLGSGAVFLNTTHDKYLLNDINKDLINVFHQVKKNCNQFINDLIPFFTPEQNSPERYYELRLIFNATDDTYLKALLFVYLNRHGFQGLCRYNLSGVFNVPYGHYKKVRLPIEEIKAAAKKSKKAKFISQPFTEVFRRARAGDVIYCDPPYTKLTETARFTSYFTNGFSNADHIKLADLAVKARDRGVGVVISNHETPATNRLYSSADIKRTISVRRSINAKSSSQKTAKELIVAYLPSRQPC